MKKFGIIKSSLWPEPSSESSPLKKKLRLSFLFSLLFILAITVSCNKDEDVHPEDTDNGTETPGDGKPEADAGNIGLVIDTRPIFKKGYEAASVKITFSGGWSAYSQDLPVDGITNFAIFRIERETLTEDDIKQLKDGVPLDIQVLDDQGQEIAHITEEKVTIDASNLPFSVTTDLPKIFPPVQLNPNVPYLVQNVNASEFDIDPNSAYTWDDVGPDISVYSYTGNNDGRSFYFEQVEEGNDSTFYIRSKKSDVYLKIGDNPRISSDACKNFPLTLLIPSDETTAPDDPAYKFVLKQDEGGITIRPKNGTVLKYSSYTLCYVSIQNIIMTEEGYGPVVRLRMVTADIQWTVEDKGTEFNDPILPPTDIDFSYDAPLENCSSATLTESVGKQDTRISSYTISSEETFQLTTTTETTETETSNYNANLSIQGVDIGGASYEESTSFSYGSGLSASNTKGFSETGQKEVQVSRVRTLEVPPYTVVEVYDAVMTLNNVTIPFVQKLRIRGEYNGAKLSGKEIASQLLAKPFGGVITETGSDYVTITIRGKVFVDQAMKAVTTVTEVEGGCDQKK